MRHSVTDLQVTSMEQAAEALAYARTAMLPAFTLTYTPSIRFPTDREDLPRMLDYTLAPYRSSLHLPELMNSVYHKSAGDFAAAQLHTCSSISQMYTFIRKARLDAQVGYHSSAKETNDLICMAAEIGSSLHAKLGHRPTVEKIIHVYQKWVNQTFRYVSTGLPEDHSAAALIRKGSGVCQAIAALTVLVLPHLGLQTCYISGDGLGTDGFGSHAWNLIRVMPPSRDAAVEEQLQWQHVDFTFGMNNPTPHTLNRLSRFAFEKTHRWDTAAVTQETLCQQLREAERRSCAAIRLRADRPDWQLGDITVTSPRPLLVGRPGQGHWIDLYAILRFLEGGCEYLPAENRLRICLNHRQYLIDNGSAYLGGPAGYLSVSVLRHLPLYLSGGDDTLCIRMVAT